jgi:20S proteasome alpha/beta subunit
MTLAIGTLYQGGALVCADTLISSETFGEYDSKVQGYQFHDGQAIFAFSGDQVLAENAIQKCEPVLGSHKSPRTKSEIASAINSVLTREYKTHVPTPGDGYWLVIAVRSEVDGMELYYTDLSTMQKSRKKYRCTGSGSELCRMFFRQLYGRDVDRLQAWNIAAYALVMAKTFVPGSVGGDPVMLDLRETGIITASGYKDFRMVEKYAPAFNGCSNAALLSFLDIENDAAYAEAMDWMSRDLSHLRQQWKEEIRGVFSNPLPQALGAVIDLR